MRQSAKFFACLPGLLFVCMHCAVAQSPVASATPAPSATPQAKLPPLEIPIPVKQKASGLTFPYRENGKLKMFFNIDEVLRADEDHLQMTRSKIQTFDDDGKADMTVLLPVSLLDLNTRMLTTSQPFLVRRTDFSLVGESLQLNTLTRQGIIKGKVKMVIFNFNDTQKEPAR